MTVTTPRWERTLTMTAWEKRREKTFIRILSPARERGVVTLRIGNEMWNYLPRVERVIKIPPSMMLQSWMGSDFTNDDLVKESSIVDDYTHEITGTETVGKDIAFKVVATPKEDAPVVWGSIVYWVRKADYVPLKEEFYSENKELVRLLEFSEIREVGGRVIPTTWTMTPVKKPGRKTVFRIIEMEFDADIPDAVFTRRNMRSVDY
jgi:outer membrane lipoprotein-sorting protein